MGDFRHFVITLVALIGGGWLLITEPALKDWLMGAIGPVLGFWFGARANGNGNGSGSGV